MACLADLETCDLPLAVACKNALAALPAASENEEALPNWRELAQAPRQKAQKLLSKRLDEKLYADLLSNLNAENRARLRSCGGPFAAGWQLATPTLPAERLEDADFKVTARALLGQDLAGASNETCCDRHTPGERTGQACGAALCNKAHHAYRCALGGGPKKRSLAAERVVERIHRECGYHTAREVHVSAWDRFLWRCTAAACRQRGTAVAPPAGSCAACGGALATEREEAFLDLEARSPDEPRVFLDVTVRHGVPGDAARLNRAAAQNGVVNKEAEAKKKARYPDGRTPWKVTPFALETFGRLGRTALAHLRKLARTQAQRLEEGAHEAASTLALLWGGHLSVALQRANAEALRTALGEEDKQKNTRDQLAADLAG